MAHRKTPNQPTATTCLIVLVALALSDCAGMAAPDDSAQANPETTPYVIVLGTAQDAGLPQIGCTGPNCMAARADPARRRFVASLLVVDPRTGKRWLIDATPDIREQFELARNHPPTRRDEGPRPALFDGIFLTHAHMGHYTGLIHLGREAYNANKVPVYGSARMVKYLNGNEPWHFLVKNANIELHQLEPDRAASLGEELSITPLLIPHRAELTDTFGFIIRGPNRSILYIPDIDKWERWERSIERNIAMVDIAIVDGSFYEEGEIPGRSMAEIAHPLIKESIQRFADLPLDERRKIVFTHLNHTNPAADPESHATSAIREQGMDVAREGQRFGL